MSEAVVATSNTARITTTECAAYGAAQPPLPLRDYDDSNTYDVIDQGSLAYDYVRSTQFGGVRAVPRPGRRSVNAGDIGSVETEGAYVI